MLEPITLTVTKVEAEQDIEVSLARRRGTNETPAPEFSVVKRAARGAVVLKWQDQHSMWRSASLYLSLGDLPDDSFVIGDQFELRLAPVRKSQFPAADAEPQYAGTDIGDK